MTLKAVIIAQYLMHVLLSASIKSHTKCKHGWLGIHTVPYQTSKRLGLGCGRYGNAGVCGGCRRQRSGQGSSCSGQCFGRYLDPGSSCSGSEPVEFHTVDSIL